MDGRRGDLDVGVRKEPPLLLELGPDLSEDARGRDVEGEQRNRWEHSLFDVLEMPLPGRGPEGALEELPDADGAREPLKPLPAERYEYAEWRKARANIDYHITVDGHHYSVPFRLVREEVKVRMTATTVEAFHDGRRVAAHLRGHRKGGFTTDPTHRPKAHREHLAWPPSRLIRWAERTGPHTATIVRRILEERPHPEQGYRPCLGFLRLGDRYTPERLEAACKRAVGIRGISYRSILATMSRFPTAEGCAPRPLPLLPLPPESLPGAGGARRIRPSPGLAGPRVCTRPSDRTSLSPICTRSWRPSC
jgi:hypothetical protein